VQKAAYLGSHMEYSVTLDGIEGEFFVSDLETARPLAAGDAAQITVNPSGVALVLPD
jgi:hypothetical protein